ncbi:hypothetical protein V6Z12_D13G111400 [Gossypium hirsutum]|uniref:Uncharacterized protein isoform X8 n=2 Tax=Gossypium TaxID=3633 RepID=A0ABM3BCU3_GOSHI|nr:uncharacterized protein LOC107920551 isoform X8 [Gossypium hirsutum]XP_040964866.1 uncharacterized protein LOC107920551 isoform X8 [Gossypium hirsutum]XP_040964867.1 uncharacterized protein LOC107920551 isoform X8 [Gossypium hirsutum]XP_040964868.1 uncharacterized protein LOC107920551 isoform X8 [Gossypium hirsutum]XP_040964869.1 uncharacterized protein LOC107920551 isoform X8 [Gossypium hirsutum]
MAAISCFLRLRHSSPSSKVRIGSGSFGEIYLGTNLQTNEEVAIKFLKEWLKVVTRGKISLKGVLSVLLLPLLLWLV